MCTETNEVGGRTGVEHYLTLRRHRERGIRKSKRKTRKRERWREAQV